MRLLPETPFAEPKPTPGFSDNSFQNVSLLGALFFCTEELSPAPDWPGSKSTRCRSEGHAKCKAGDRILTFVGRSKSLAFRPRSPRETWGSSSDATPRDGHQGNAGGISNYCNFQRG